MSDNLIEITDEERAKVFQDIFGSNIIKVTSSSPQDLELPSGEIVKAFYLDLTQITSEQRKKLVTYLAESFNFSEIEVNDKLEAIGVPILEKNCVLKE